MKENECGKSEGIEGCIEVDGDSLEIKYTAYATGHYPIGTRFMNTKSVDTFELSLEENQISNCLFWDNE
jgi:hypothetical protein